jgi:hypothetical protein
MSEAPNQPTEPAEPQPDPSVEPPAAEPPPEPPVEQPAAPVAEPPSPEPAPQSPPTPQPAAPVAEPPSPEPAPQSAPTPPEPAVEQPPPPVAEPRSPEPAPQPAPTPPEPSVEQPPPPVAEPPSPEPAPQPPPAVPIPTGSAPPGVPEGPPGTPAPPPEGEPGAVEELPAIPVEEPNPSWGPISPGEVRDRNRQPTSPVPPAAQVHADVPSPPTSAQPAAPADAVAGPAVVPVVRERDARDGPPEGAVVSVDPVDLLTLRESLRGVAAELQSMAARLATVRTGLGLSPAMQAVVAELAERHGTSLESVAAEFLEEADHLARRARLIEGGEEGGCQPGAV